MLVVLNLAENIYSCGSIGDDRRTRTRSARQILKRSRSLLWRANRGHEAGNTRFLPHSLFLFTGKKKEEQEHYGLLNVCRDTKLAQSLFGMALTLGYYVDRKFLLVSQFFF